MPQQFSTGPRADESPDVDGWRDLRRASSTGASRPAKTDRQAPAIEQLEGRQLLSTTVVATPPSNVSPVASVTNTLNESTTSLNTYVKPAPTITVKGTNGGDATAPTPVITLLGSTGVTPHTVFVHALDSVLGAGTPLTARYTWNFGDPGSEYNTLVGWNAAHTYDNPGVYTITLTETNQLGKTRILSTTVNEGVTKFTHSIYVDSVSGSDSNLGITPNAPVKTAARAMVMMGSNTQMLFHAGETFNITAGIPLPYTNVLIGSYGAGASPVLVRQPGVGSNIFVTFSSSVNVMIENLTMTSPYTPVGVIADVIPASGIAVAGTDISIRNCTFLNLDDAVNEEGNPQGIIVQDCTAPLATGLRGCLVWGQGTDQVFLGNSDANSTRQQVFRSVQTVRQLIAYNNFTNLDRRSLGDWGDYSKGAIDVHRGSYAYVSNNWVYDGELRIGPRQGPGVVPGDISQWAVFEDNHTSEAVFQIYPGTYDVMVRNNIFSTSNGPLINVNASSIGGNIQDITFENNTGISTGVAANFILISQGAAAHSVNLQNNLWIAPLIVPGTHLDSAVCIEDYTAAVLNVSEGNVWQMPKTFNKYANGGINYVNPTWNPPHGYYTPTAWNALPFAKNDHFTATVVSADYTPAVGSVAATAGVQVYGVFVDIYGNPRPITGAISAGAVQTPGVP